MLKIVQTLSFKKDFKRTLKQVKDVSLIKEIIIKLSELNVLDKKYRDHLLMGNYKNKIECHIMPDWLLIYEISNHELVLYRTGYHLELFKK